MSLYQASSSLPPNKAVDKPDLLNSRKRLQYLTKAAVDKACKMRVESRRLVRIVDTQSCGSSSRLGLSNPLSALSSALTKRPSPASPSTSRQWFLSRESSDRRAVAARIHSLLIEWKADPSLEWKARVASAVPVLEEALYKGAKSKDEYTNPQLLESQLVHVLRQFEAGNGAFLLQGYTPPYSLRASSSSSSPSVKMSPFRQNTLGHSLTMGKGIFELVSEQRSGTARVSSVDSSALGFSPNVHEIVQSGEVDTKGESPGNRFISKVANMLAKKRRESSTSLRLELGRANSGSKTAEDVEGRINVGGGMSAVSGQVHASFCSRDEGRRSTLGGILQLNTVNASTEQRVTCIDAEEAFPARSRTDQQTGSARIPPLLVSDDESSSMSVTAEVQLESGDTSESFMDQEQDAQGGQRSIQSSSSSSASSFTPVSSSFFLPSTTTCTSTSSSSSSLILSSSLHVFPLSPQPTPLLLPPSSLSASCAMSASCALSASALQQQQLCTSAAGPNSSSQHRSECQPQQLVTLGAGTDEASQLYITREPNNYTPQNVQSQSFCLLSTRPQPQVELQQSSRQPLFAEADRGSSSSSSLRSVSIEVMSKEKAVKLPLGRFLAERDDYKGYASRYLDGGYPWETWEEATEQVDGMCCVCMVGLKGAAFIPCGHTFCRKCSRELWRGRGTCPLCNRYIREILDIY